MSRRTAAKVINIILLVSILVGIVLYFIDTGKRLFQEEPVYSRIIGKRGGEGYYDTDGED